MAAKKKASLKIYKLFDSGAGPTSSQDAYGAFSKKIYHVAATSVKQAILLAGRKTWSDGGPGLVEYRDDEGQWHKKDGSTSWSQTYSHAQRFDPEQPQ